MPQKEPNSTPPQADTGFSFNEINTDMIDFYGEPSFDIKAKKGLQVYYNGIFLGNFESCMARDAAKNLAQDSYSLYRAATTLSLADGVDDKRHITMKYKGSTNTENYLAEIRQMVQKEQIGFDIAAILCIGFAQLALRKEPEFYERFEKMAKQYAQIHVYGLGTEEKTVSGTYPFLDSNKELDFRNRLSSGGTDPNIPPTPQR